MKYTLKCYLLFLVLFSFMITPFHYLQAKVVSGTSGDTITYTMDTEKKTFIIEGSGVLGEYGYSGNTSDFNVLRGLNCIIGEGITEIRNLQVPYYTESLKLPQSLTTIGEGAFSDCYSLSEIEIPKNVNKIGKTALKGCNRLKTITNHSNQTVFLPNFPSFSDYVPYDYYVGEEPVVTLEPGETANAKPRMFVLLLDRNGGKFKNSKVSSQTYFRVDEPIKLPVVEKKGYIFCGWTAKKDSNIGWYTIPGDDRDCYYGSTGFWAGPRIVYAQYAKVGVKRPGGKKIKLNISRWRDAKKLEIRYSTDKKFKKYKSVTIKSDNLKNIGIFGKRNKKKQYQINYAKKKKMLTVTYYKVKKKKTYYFRFRYSGIYKNNMTEQYIDYDGEWFSQKASRL